jgi:N-formylglutamate amidohydrolase
VHAVQIEINRALYLDELAFKPTTGFYRLKTDLTRIAGRMFTEIPAMIEKRAAAE